MEPTRHRRRRRRSFLLAGVSLLSAPPTALVAAALLLAGAGACTAGLAGGGVGDTPSAPAMAQIPSKLLAIYEQVGAQYRIPWEVLAAIGNFECSFGRTSDPSCTPIPGATGPGVGNYDDASGPMQIGIGGPSGDSYDALRHFLANPALGPHDPVTAVQLAALHLLHEDHAPTGHPIDAYQSALVGYGGGYASQAIALAQSFQGTGTTVFAGSSSGCAAGPGQYANPFAHARNLVAERIDMGVDYAGAGEIDALGNARVTFAGTGIGGGWVCDGANGGVVYQLQDGPDAKRYVYDAEGVAPTVQVGQNISAGQEIATFAPTANGCIEIGWAAGPGSPITMAAAENQQPGGGDAGGNRTYCGNQMSDLLHSLGVPAGLPEGKPITGNRC